MKRQDDYSHLEFIQLLGEGSYGKVYKAINIKTGQIVAVKVIENNDVGQGISQTTLRELTILSSLKHPNIIKLNHYNIIEEYNEPKVELIFQYMDEDLHRHRKKLQNYEPHIIKNIMRQIVQGIRYIHQRKVIHRDLKPQNILINEDNLNVKIADFGLARSVSYKLVTMSKQIETMWYRSPELLLGTKRYDYGVDIWSLGCIFYQIAQGKVLFKEDCQLGQIIAIFKYFGTPRKEQWKQIIHLQDFKATFPKFYPEQHVYQYLDEKGADLLQKMLIVNPNKRISIKEVCEHPYFKEE